MNKAMVALCNTASLTLTPADDKNEIREEYLNEMASNLEACAGSLHQEEVMVVVSLHGFTDPVR
jgi:hypothetical protein